MSLIVFGGIDWKKMNALARQALKQVGYRYRCDPTVGELFGCHPTNGGHCPLA